MRYQTLLEHWHSASFSFESVANAARTRVFFSSCSNACQTLHEREPSVSILFERVSNATRTWTFCLDYVRTRVKRYTNVNFLFHFCSNALSNATRTRTFCLDFVWMRYQMQHERPWSITSHLFHPHYSLFVLYHSMFILTYGYIFNYLFAWCARLLLFNMLAYVNVIYLCFCVYQYNVFVRLYVYHHFGITIVYLRSCIYEYNVLMKLHACRILTYFYACKLRYRTHANWNIGCRQTWTLFWCM